MTKVKDIAVDTVERKVEKEKKKAKKKVKKMIRRTIRTILWTIFVLCCGICVGVHWKVVRALVTGKDMPKLPAGHPHCCKKSMFRI